MTVEQKNPPHLEIKLLVEAGVQPNVKRLFMSFGLLNRLASLIGGVDGVPLLAENTDLQRQVLLEVFTEREKGVPRYIPDSLDEIEVSLDDIIIILDWVGGHVLNFFLNSTEAVLRRTQKEQSRMVRLRATSDGLAASLLPTPAASPSESSAAT